MATSPAETPCPVCDLPAAEVVDADGDAFTTCHVCGLVYVTPSYAEGPTLSYVPAELSAEREAMLATLRLERDQSKHDAS